jgi:adenine deaminase
MTTSLANLDRRVRVARGSGPVDLLLKNANLINVLSGNIQKTHIAIFSGQVVGFGDYPTHQEIDLGGAYVCPGFFDGHVHIESSYLVPQEFARAVVPRGTTTVIIDPHEIANVLGLEGIRYMLDETEKVPLDVYIMLPSCVPSTDMETSGAILTSSDLEMFLGMDRVLGVGEMMNFPGVIERDPEVLKKILMAHRKRIDGHSPGLSGRDLSAYISAGIRSDHETTDTDEAREKLENGMYLMIREGTTARNLESLLPAITSTNSRRAFFVTDDRHPLDLRDDGHIDAVVRKAIRLGLDPILAIQMATLNAAEYFRLEDSGAIAPGYQADLVVFDDLKSLNIRDVYKSGQLVARDGRMMKRRPRHVSSGIRSTVNTHWMLIQDMRVKDRGKKVRIIEIVPDQIYTRASVARLPADGGFLMPDLNRDILKTVVVERHMASGQVGVGFVRGFGLKRGALASTVSHDSHNIVAVGTSDDEILAAAIEIVKLRGGQVAVENGRLLDSLPLPIAGLMTERPLNDVARTVERLARICRRLGSDLHDPFMALSFISLPVIPELKLTNRGLVDVTAFKQVPLYVD